MSLAEKLQRLILLVPGVEGYRDRETSRDTDKNVRDRLAEKLGDSQRTLEQEKRFFMELKEFPVLPYLDRISSRLGKLANELKFASRGYRGFFDQNRPDEAKLDELYNFDLALFEGVQKLNELARSLATMRNNARSYREGVDQLTSEVDRFESHLSTRHQILDDPQEK